jgi:hypothetical protein
MKKPNPPKVWPDWSHATEERVLAFQTKVWRLAEATFGVDTDGDCPVAVVVIDRPREQPLHFYPLRQTHRAWDAQKRGDPVAAKAFRALLMENLRTARGNVTQAAENIRQVTEELLALDRDEAKRPAVEL